MSELEAVKAFAPIGAAIIVSASGIYGWFTTSRLNRENEPFKQKLAERLRRRTKMCERVIQAMLPIIDTANRAGPPPGADELHKLLSDANIYVNLYGDDDEVRTFRVFLGKVENRGGGPTVTLTPDDLNSVIGLFRKKLRSEVGYNKP